jgi:hypothetical protein
MNGNVVPSSGRTVTTYLRFGALALSLCLCAMLVVLWIRSYYGDDGLCLGFTKKCGVMALSSSGGLRLDFIPHIGGDFTISGWEVESAGPGQLQGWLGRDFRRGPVGFLYQEFPHGNWRVRAPHWAALLWALVPVMILLRKRFSVLAMLVVLSLGAVTLGVFAVSERASTEIIDPRSYDERN